MKKESRFIYIEKLKKMHTSKWYTKQYQDRMKFLPKIQLDKMDYDDSIAYIQEHAGLGLFKSSEV